MKKVELTLKQMVEAVNVNVDNPWEVVGLEVCGRMGLL